jgi:hypothetical protein
MSERVSRVREEAAELTDEIARHRQAGRQSPLEEVRDFRYEPGLTVDESEPEAPRRSTANDAFRRRRRR